MVFMRVGEQIIEFPRRSDRCLIRSRCIQRVAVEEHQFITMAPNSHMSRTYFVMRPVAVVHGLPPVARSLAFQVVTEAAAFAARRSIHSGIVG